MKKLFTFLLALMASSCLWASITYELNDGGTGEAKYNDYGWNNKSEMFAACMAEAGVTGLASLDDLKAAGTASFTTICTPLNATKCQVILDSEKWEWLEQYIMSVQNPQKGTIVGGGAIAELIANTADAGWRFAIAAFFLEMQNTAWPRTADFSEAGKDAAYVPAWGQSYGNPEHPTEEVTLVAPYRAGYLFDGWYDNPECTGTPITTVNASTTGTLYAKWVLDGIVYELNGGVWNEYRWNNKSEMFAACMAEAGVTGLASLDDLKAAGTASFTTICTPLNATKCQVILDSEKWEWLEQYIMSVQNPQKGTIVGGGAIAELIANTADAGWRFAIAAFFLEMQNTAWPRTADFSEAGKDAAYIPAWGQNYPSPEHPTEEVTLHTPFKEGYKFLGWYDNEACTGTPITTVNASTTGTLYAKWVLDGIVYELNGGVWNEYGWNNKSDMFAVCMAEAGVTGLASLDDLKAAGTASFTTICTPLNATKCQVILDSEKWEWLEQYIMSVQNPQKGTIVGGGTIAELIANTADAGWRFAIAAFFLEMQNTAWPRTADFSEAGKDAAYIPAWGQSYGNPEHPTEEVTLVAPYKPRYNFEGWYDNAECTGAAITTVDQTYAGTLYAKWSIAPITYNLNGGQYNEYGWESKKDMYEDLNVDWNAFANKTNTWPAYETVYGVGNSNNGVAGKTDATFSTFFTNASYKDKWGWMVTYLDEIAKKQGKTLPSTDAIPLRWGVGNFLCDDNNGSTTWHKAVDCTGEDGQLYTAQAYCSFTLPNPMYPTKEVTLNNPTKEGYIFDGWYASADFSGAKVTKVNADTKGTLYAKWKEDAYTRDVTNGNYGTICLPNGSNQMTGAIFFEIAYRDGSYVYLDQVTELVAGVPYIFRATSNQIKVMYNSTYSATAGNANGLYGTFAAMGGTDLVDKYVITNNTIKKCLVGSTLKANRAYIEVDHIDTHARQAAPGRQRVAMGYQGENEATGVDNVNGMNPAMEGVYDVMGRKLTEPTSTGFYIINGKKVFVVK